MNAALLPGEGLQPTGPRIGRRRFVVLALLCLCNACLYLARISISVGVVYMYPGTSAEATATKANVLAGFYYGYLISQVPAGAAAQRFGGKAVLLVAVLIWSLASVAAVWSHGSVVALVATRVAVGFAEGCNYPSQVVLVGRWVPKHEYSRAWALITAGESIGTVAALLGSPFLVHYCGWESIFYTSAGVSVVWAAAFACMVTADPCDSDSISPEELAYIQSDSAGDVAAAAEDGGVPGSSGRRQESTAKFPHDFRITTFRTRFRSSSTLQARLCGEFPLARVLSCPAVWGLLAGEYPSRLSFCFSCSLSA